MHINFYEETLREDDVRLGIATAKALIDLLEGVAPKPNRQGGFGGSSDSFADRVVTDAGELFPRRLRASTTGGRFSLRATS